MEHIRCPFCGQLIGQSSIYEIFDDVREIKCDRIIEREMSIVMTDEFISDCLPSLTNVDKVMMLYFVLNSPQKIIFTSGIITNAPREGYKHISYKMLQKAYPTSIDKRIDMILQNLRSIHPVYGDSIVLGKSESEFSDNTLRYLFLPEKDDRIVCWSILKMLIDMGYISPYIGTTSTDGSRYVLTAKAWERLENIRNVVDDGTIFVAMSFGDDPQLMHFRERIREAARQCGYRIVIIDEQQHNEYIPVEIEYEIRKASAMIADFTDNKAGVYFEAGLARGMSKQVIFTCMNCPYHKDSIHFDTKQINTIFWSDNENQENDDLVTRLKRRILSTVGTGKYKGN